MTKEKDFIIYKTINLITGKIYIGQSIYNNPKYLGSGKPYFENALNKYSRKNFKKEILKDNIPSQYMLDYWEQFYILKYGSVSPFGYNLEWGGNGVGKHSKESKQKMSENNGRYWKGRKLSKEHKQKLSRSREGKIPWNKGKTNVYSKETLQKMKDVQLGKHHSKKTKLKMSKSKKGQIPWNKGKKMSGKTKLKMSESRIKYRISKKDLYEVYIVKNKSQRQTAKYFNCSQGVISRQLKRYNIKK